MGRVAAANVLRRLAGASSKPFRYRDTVFATASADCWPALRREAAGPPCASSGDGKRRGTICSMSADADFATHCCELLAAAGEVQSRRMFGGYGFYVDDLFVAIIVGDALYLKADEQSRPRFQEAGCHRFEYTRQGKTRGMAFWTVPTEAMDSPALMRPWAQLAVDAALRARAGKRRH